jgi:hypothetical protein
MSAGVPTPTLLNYSDVVDVNMSSTNDVNFADIDNYGHRVSVSIEKSRLNEIFKWQRAVGAAQPSAKIGVTTGFRAALIDALSTTYTDIDGVTGGLHFGSANLSTNFDTRLRKDGAISANDIPMAFILYKLYGRSSVTTLGHIFNLQDGHDMLSNATVADAIIASLVEQESAAVNTMFKDLIAADPRRFFNTNGTSVTGIFETNTDVSGNGSWNFTDDDIIEIKTKMVFNSRVSRRGVGGDETDVTETDLTLTQNNQQTIIAPGDFFFIRLQLKAADIGIASSLAAVQSVSSASSFNTALTNLSSNLTSTNRASAKADIKANISTIKANLGGVDFVSVTGAAIQGFITDSIPGYNVSTRDKIFLLYESGGTVNLTNSTTEEELSAGTKEIYLFGLPGETVTLTLSTGSYTLTTTSTGVIYNGTTYALGSSIVLGTFTFALNFLGSGGGTLRRFRPKQIVNLNMWLDGADASTFTYSSSNNISSWADKSGLGNNLNYSSGTYLKKITDGTRSVVNSTTRTSMYYSALTSTYSSGKYTIFLVMKKPNTTYSQAIKIGTSFVLLHDYDYGGGPGLPAGGPPPSSSLSGTLVAINGSRTIPITSSTISNYHLVRTTINRNETAKILFGNNNEAMIANVAEMIVYNGSVALTTAQNQQVEGYLAWKWGLTSVLPADHAWKNVPPV